MKVDELVEIANTVSNALDGEDVPREVVLQMLNGIQPGTIFDDVVSQRRVQGWVYGREFHGVLQRDPKIIAYGELEPEVRMVLEAVHAVVYALRFYLETEKVESGTVEDEDTDTEWNKFTPLKDPVTT